MVAVLPERELPLTHERQLGRDIAAPFPARAKDGLEGITTLRILRQGPFTGVRLQLHALAYNLSNFMRTLEMPKGAEACSLTNLREKLITIGRSLATAGTSPLSWRK